MDGLNSVPTMSESTRITAQTLPLKSGQSREQCGGSLQVIVICFFILTLAITIALAAQIHLGDYQVVPHGSVATDSHECSTVGTNILKQGGNAVDAAVASTLCMGVVNPHITGIGGGGFLIVYDHRKRLVKDVIDFREVSPQQVGLGASDPGLDIGVPGLIRGLALAHSLHGLLPWRDVVMPSVEIARFGFQVPANLASARSKLVPSLWNQKLHDMMESFESAGSTLKLAQLADTLQMIAVMGPDVIYNGSLSAQILTAVTAAGGQMVQQDLSDYAPVRQSATITTFGGFHVIVPGAPSGGPLLVNMLQLLNGSQADQSQTVAAMQQVITSHSQTWGKPDVNPSDSEPVLSNNLTGWNFPEAVGSHVAAIDTNDLYVSIVSGLNTLFGSELLTDGGFILNNALVNFGSAGNAEGGGKRPLSLATPVIAVQVPAICGRRLVLGAGDFSVAAQTLAQLVSNNNISNSVEAPRFRITNQPYTFGFERWHGNKVSDATTEKLEGLGYILEALSEPYQSCNLVEKIGDDLSSHSDSRGQGIASRF